MNRMSRRTTPEAAAAPGVRHEDLPPSVSAACAASALAGGVVERRTLFERLGGAARVTQLSGLAGSGKTVLLRSWITKWGLAARAGWVAVPRDTRDPQRFWHLVLEALCATRAGANLVRGFTGMPELDGRTTVERLLDDLRGLQERLWLVIDDLHELRSEEALQQLELLVMRAPSALQIVLAARHDVQLGAHRLRLAGELTEIRTGDLHFTLEESRALFAAAGVRLSESALELLQRRTEGWAAGLRLAALALEGHPDPERFAAEFCGSERTVAEYLLNEVLDRQPNAVRQLLLRTSVLQRVNGALADHLTGGAGGEGMLRALEKANAFVFALDTQRSWFRYHPLFADLLRFELRQAAPAELLRLHTAAAEWYAAQGSSGQLLDFPGGSGAESRAGSTRALLEPLSESESRILRYLPTNLSRSEIAVELYVSVNTVKTHMSRLFAKLDAHSRTQTVERARELGLLAPRPRQLLPRQPGSARVATASTSQSANPAPDATQVTSRSAFGLLNAAR
jgi:ATP/maltotriose-dependent transcriptional regulator MalT